MQNLTFVARPRENSWRGALIIDGNFVDAEVDAILSPLLQKAASTFVAPVVTKDCIVTLTINVTPAGEENAPTG